MTFQNFWSSENNNQNNNNTNGGPSSNNNWVTYKAQGKAAYERGDYVSALQGYASALNPLLECPATERQLILSNIVACRLNIGGPAQAEAAVSAAKQCIQINDQWAKGHVRLASAYIALGGHSNDACNALQKALQLDPGNPTARDMLVRELRRGHADQYNNNNNTNSNRPTPSAPPEDLDDDRRSSRSAGSMPSATTASMPSAPPQDHDDRNYSASQNTTSDTPSQQQQQQQQQQQNPPMGNNNNNIFVEDLDESISWTDRASFYYGQAKHWYRNQSDEKRSVIKVAVVLLILYVAFGGRFGLTSLSQNKKQPRGHYGAGNVYDKYYQKLPKPSSSSTYNNNHYQTQQQQQQQYHHQDDDYYSRRSSSRGRGGGGSSFHFPNLMDGSFQSMAILAGIVYVAHRNGINPMQAIFFLNMMNGGGRRRMGRGVYVGGGGFGRAGGFGRRRW